MIRRSPPPDSPGLLRVSSRLVTPDDVAFIRDVRTRHPEWTRQALARHLCQVWDWRSADGSFRLRACRDLLKRLAAKGHCTLRVIAHPRTYESGSQPIDQSGGREIRVEDDGIFR